LDFGLAKLRPQAALSVVSMAATMPTPPLTGQGTILGTLQYMAPEQLEGQEADARTDIFTFGTVVYETVTGRKAFDGKSQGRKSSQTARQSNLLFNTNSDISDSGFARIGHWIYLDRPSRNSCSQRLAFQVLHDEVVGPVLMADVMERVNVRMLKRGDGVRSNRISRALYTSPKPPAPIGARIS
jgi:serine/threonine protein kinase